MLFLVTIWILLSALLVGAGWILSIFHELNRVGYGMVFALAVFMFFFWVRRMKLRSRNNFAQFFKKFRRRFKRPAPLIFLALALLSLIAGLLYVPADGDSNAYRIPRVLQWLGAGQWDWIHTSDVRMNIAGCGFEWLAAPLILFTHSFRSVFLINWISFLLLPGLIFSVFIRMQVRPRTAWWWMWLLSSGWCYAMQASSVVNDCFAVIYALAAMDFALRSLERKNVSDLWLALLAAALLTGAKQTIMPLTLVCAVAIIPSLALLRTRLIGTTVVLVCVLLVSAGPLMFFNHEHTGTWLGIPPNTGPQAMFWARCQPDSPLWGIIGNAFCLSLQNLVPPIFPWADEWNGMMKQFLQTSFGSHFTSFEDFGRLERATTEGSAGIGLGIFLLIFISTLAAHFRRFIHSGITTKTDLFQKLLRWSPYLALLIFMAKVGSHANARQLGSYYVFFFPLLLVGEAHSYLVRQHWWQRLGLSVMLLAAILLIVSRSHPLFPAQSMLNALESRRPHSSFLSKIDQSYSFWTSMRALIVNPLKNEIPPGEQVIGYATVVGFFEPGLWLPFGSCKVERLLPGDAVEELKQRNIHYLVIGDEFFEATKEKTIEEWLNKYGGQLIDQTSYNYSPGGSVRQLYLVRLQ